MATYEAVGAVGLTLQRLLADRIEHPNGTGDPVPVTLGHPGPERDPEGAAEAARVNLFLFRVSENGFLKNQDLPGRGSRGEFGHPPLSLDLHYLLTVFGSTSNAGFFDETPAHHLLGSAMRVLHDHAIITDRVVTRRSPAGVPVLDPALQDEHERIKLTLQPLDLEDLSNVWTSLELSYRLSVGYEVSVVQLESRRPRRYPRPVQELPGAGPRVYAAPLRRPRITSVAVRRAGDPPDLEHPPFARVGDTLIVRGSNLGAGGLMVRLAGVDLAPDTVSPAGDRLEVIVPDDQLPDGTPIPPEARLQPGSRTVEVVAPVPGLPGAPVGSGRAAFVLVPELAGASVADRTLTLTGTRLLGEELGGQVVVGDVAVERDHYLAGSDDTSVQVILPATLPAFPGAARVSGALSPFPSLPSRFDLEVTMGAEGPVTATLDGEPGSIEEAAALLQAALRAADPAPAFAGALVAATPEALIVVPGDLTSPVSFRSGALANGLQLTGSSSARQVYLSGVLRPFPELSAPSPELDLEIGGTIARLPLGSRPASVGDAADALEAAVRGADPAATFADARIVAVEDRLCLLPGADAAVAFTAAPGDPTTVPELQLSGLYVVRVRVGSVESIDEVAVALPS